MGNFLCFSEFIASDSGLSCPIYGPDKQLVHVQQRKVLEKSRTNLAFESSSLWSPKIAVMFSARRSGK